MLDLLNLVFSRDTSSKDYPKKLAAEIDRIVDLRVKGGEYHRHRIDLLLGLGHALLRVSDEDGEVDYMEYISFEKIDIKDFDPESLGKHAQVQLIKTGLGVMVIDMRGECEEQAVFYPYEGFRTHTSTRTLFSILRQLTSDTFDQIRDPTQIAESLMFAGNRRGAQLQDVELQVSKSGEAMLSFHFGTSRGHVHYMYSRHTHKMEKLERWKVLEDVKFTITASGLRNFSISYPPPSEPT